MRIGLLLLLAFVLFGVLGFRLWYLQILTADQYAAVANANRERTIPVEAPRGVIYDRNGQPLVMNRGGPSVDLLPMDMKSPKKDPAGFQSELSNLASLLGMTKVDLTRLHTQAAKDPFVDTVVKQDEPLTPVVDYLKKHSADSPGSRCRPPSCVAIQARHWQRRYQRKGPANAGLAKAEHKRERLRRRIDRKGAESCRDWVAASSFAVIASPKVASCRWSAEATGRSSLSLRGSWWEDGARAIVQPRSAACAPKLGHGGLGQVWAPSRSWPSPSSPGVSPETAWPMRSTRPR